MRWMILMAIAAFATARPAIARELPVPADKGWQHAETKLILRTTLGGLSRTGLADLGDIEHDIVAQFTDEGDANSITVYLFHPGIDSVPIWFDRSDYALRHRDIYGGATPVDTLIAFAPPNAKVATGLRQMYRPAKGPYRATALATIPLGDWLVTVRYSSKTLEPVALSTKLTAVISEIGWPTTAPVPTDAAVPVATCPKTLSYSKKARLKKSDMTQALLGGLIAAAAKTEPASMSSKPWCREGEATADYAVYRSQDQTDGYLMALGDGGVAVGVNPALTLPGLPSTGGYSVQLLDLNGGAATYPSFDRMPTPKQVFDLVVNNQAVSRTSGNGKDVTIDLPNGS